ncbi:protein UPSTREAM OF FLC-like protein [Carex littledalei]|uniref:Protein UPSTREAM OF FLC-like protein n=1 Tax=Carex littledalei TaxID=544730 RepID=A0A833Q9N9_9POAL|nr:protein UPSTREAM OF FLC-like protein [Carex littledalei]
MVTTSKGRGEATKEWEEERQQKKWPDSRPQLSEKSVAVVYYLSRNGHLEHPHFMEVPLSSSDGLYLKDVINRVSALRGRGFAGLFSWSAKRSYKNGYVWHDLTEEDFIHPVHGNEYVLKGTELLNIGPVSCSENSVGTASSTSNTGKILETSKSSRGNFDFSAPLMRSQKKNWGSLELKEYNVYRAKLMEPDNKTGNNFTNVNQSTDASTQTEEKRYRRREITYPPANLTVENKTIELMRDGYSPPPTSSPETLETLVRRYNGRIVGDQYLMASNVRGKTSAVLMHLISCGSIAVKGQRVAVVPQHGARLTKGSHSPIGGSCRLSGGAKVVVEKEYFSGSLLEAKEDEQIAAVLKRCSSYNAERGMKMELAKETERVHSRCMPRNSKPRKEGSNGSTYLPPITRSSTQGSKRFNT